MRYERRAAASSLPYLQDQPNMPNLRTVHPVALPLIAAPCVQMAIRASSLTAENKRRTLQRNDIAMAVAKTDTYDFLIDIVPRDEVRLEGMVVLLPVELGGHVQYDIVANRHMSLVVSFRSECKVLLRSCGAVHGNWGRTSLRLRSTTPKASLA